VKSFVNVFCALILSQIIVSLAAAADVPQAVALPLFDGQTLAHWIVSDCKAEAASGSLFVSGDQGSLRSELTYDDFVFSFEWRSLDGRAVLPEVAFRGGVKLSAETPKISTADWNRYSLRVHGEVATLTVNDQVVASSEAIARGCGPLVMSVGGEPTGRLEFRNLSIEEAHHRPLFNGKDLSQWKGAGSDAAACWDVADGLLRCTGKKGPWLRSSQQHGDFNLRLEYLLKPGGNSGVYVRVPADGNHHGRGAGMEIQLLDDDHPRYDKLKPYQFTGSAYAVAAASPRVGREPGRWNSLEIDLNGGRYRITHNGTTILDVTTDTVPQLQERRLSGYLGLQNHSEEVLFRNLRIGPPQYPTAAR